MKMCIKIKAHGINIQLRNESLTLHGAVVCVCGDIPASNYIGGFKEGVGTGKKLYLCLQYIYSAYKVNLTFVYVLIIFPLVCMCYILHIFY